MKFAKLATALLIAGFSLQGMAADMADKAADADKDSKVKVEFVHPEKFIDAGNRWSGVNDTEDFLKDLRHALVQRGEAVLAEGQDMKIQVTNVDRAGDVHPVGRDMNMIRVIKPLYRPSIELSYVVEEGGKTVREGKADISDMNFMDRFNRYFRGDMLYYEKPMLDAWFSKEFGKDVKVARQ
jgi:hypothetical protein